MTTKDIDKYEKNWKRWLTQGKVNENDYKDIMAVLETKRFSILIREALLREPMSAKEVDFNYD
jgi:hypothetical protein